MKTEYSNTHKVKKEALGKTAKEHLSGMLLKILDNIDDDVRFALETHPNEFATEVEYVLKAPKSYLKKPLFNDRVKVIYSVIHDLEKMHHSKYEEDADRQIDELYSWAKAMRKVLDVNYKLEN